MIDTLVWCVSVINSWIISQFHILNFNLILFFLSCWKIIVFEKHQQSWCLWCGLFCFVQILILILPSASDRTVPTSLVCQAESGIKSQRSKWIQSLFKFGGSSFPKDRMLVARSIVFSVKKRVNQSHHAAYRWLQTQKTIEVYRRGKNEWAASHLFVLLLHIVMVTYLTTCGYENAFEMMKNSMFHGNDNNLWHF